MDLAKKVLIGYASAGHGHAKAAAAVEEALRLQSPGTRVDIVDTLREAGPFSGGLYRQSYLLQIRYAPWLWGILYYGLDRTVPYALALPARRMLNAMTLRSLHERITREDPDVIVATHFQMAEVASRLKALGRIRSRLLTVVTDYLPHRIWTAAKTDLYAVALDETKQGLIDRGVHQKKIFVTGIPIEHKFLAALDAAALRARFGLDPELFTVLVTSGGAGIGPMRTLAAELLKLPQRVQLVVVCGTNKTLYDQLKPLSDGDPRLKLFGFAGNMQELMAVCDVVVGKGGGVTLTESLVRGKSMILFQSVPGQELRNVICVKKYQAGVAAGRVGDVVRAVADLSSQPQLAARYAQGARAMSRPNAARDIATLALTGSV